MANSIAIVIYLGPEDTGVSLRGKLYSNSAQVGGNLDSGFTEVGGGIYEYQGVDVIPDGFLGFFRVFNTSNVYQLAELAINPGMFGGEATVDLSDIEAQLAALTAALSSQEVTVTSPLVASGAIEIVAGDDYASTIANALEWTSSGWPNLTGATVKFNAKQSANGDVDIANHAVTLVSTGGASQTIRVELTDTETAALEHGTNAYVFDIVATLSSGLVHTLQLGTITVRERVG